MKHEIRLTPKQLRDLQKRGLLKDSEGQPIPRLAPRFTRRKVNVGTAVCPAGSVSVQPPPYGALETGDVCGSVYGHVFIWAGGVGVMPEGYTCSCGKAKAHYAKCPNCGHEKLEAVPI
jgi:hypothetical protein